MAPSLPTAKAYPAAGQSSGWRAAVRRAGSWLSADRWATATGNAHFWLVVGMFAIGGVLHYLAVFTPTTGLAPEGLSVYSMDRVLFLLPVVYAGFIFGLKGGAIALSVAVLFMVPEGFLLSRDPAHALTEIVAICLSRIAIISCTSGN